jgi:hypothetical protein
MLVERNAILDGRDDTTNNLKAAALHFWARQLFTPIGEADETHSQLYWLRLAPQPLTSAYVYTLRKYWRTPKLAAVQHKQYQSSRPSTTTDIFPTVLVVDCPLAACSNCEYQVSIKAQHQGSEGKPESPAEKLQMHQSSRPASSTPHRFPRRVQSAAAKLHATRAR